jgi:transposase
VTILQFVEGLSDRQAAYALRTRIDWKYALHLELEDQGFHYSVLSEFRSRLLAGEKEALLFEALLKHAKARGWIKTRGRQRTDSTHVCAAVATLSRLECVAETLRHALNVLAVAVPEWLQACVPVEWYERYATRWQDYRLPSGREERQELAQMIGSDGRRLLTLIDAASSPAWLRELPAVQTLRRVWIQQYYADEARPGWRDAKDLPPSRVLICTPYDPDARYSQKRETAWTGYKVHITETCDEEMPHLITDVQTTAAPISDFEMTPQIHETLAHADLLPDEQLMDAGYLTADHLVDAHEQYGIDLVGPVPPDTSWQTQAAMGFAVADFPIDWQAKTAQCPQGHQSYQWMSRIDRHHHEVIHIKFDPKDCLACPVRSLCTHSAKEPRSLMIRTQQAHQALQHARKQQQTSAFKDVYAKRAGIEGTLSQGARAFELRRCRYIGEPKARLQMFMTALAINLVRIAAWTLERPLGQTRRSPFAALAPTG